MIELQESLFHLFLISVVCSVVFLWRLLRTPIPHWPGWLYLVTYLVALGAIPILSNGSILFVPVVLLSALIMWIQIIRKQQFRQWFWLLILNILMLTSYLALWRLLLLAYKS